MRDRQRRGMTWTPTAISGDNDQQDGPRDPHVYQNLTKIRLAVFSGPFNFVGSWPLMGASAIVRMM